MAHKAKVFTTDWLGTRPVFYNEKTKRASYNINEVIDYKNLEFDPEGLINYLDFGYCVLGRTPVKNVRFLRWSSRLEVEEGRSLKITALPDPAEAYEGRRVAESDIWDNLHTLINTYDSSKLIIPTSGGYDSRILNFMVDDKSKILSYTYGISENQFDSYEVIFAQAICQKLGISWQRVHLAEYHRYIDDWLKIYGVSTHTHGMYHMEFYQKIIASLPCPLQSTGLISGIIGDAWAGSIDYVDVPGAEHFNAFGHTHGLTADSRFCNIKSDKEETAKFLEVNRRRLSSVYWQVILTMRLKMILLSYLVNIPHIAGIPNIYAPYLDINIALSMLNLPPERREKRRWQWEFFQRHGLDVENRGLKVNPTNVADWYAVQKYRPAPLNGNLLRELFAPEYLDWINANYYKDISGRALSAYYTLRPLQMLLEKRGGQDNVRHQIANKPPIIYIGADFIPTQPNYKLFAQGDLDELIGHELADMLLASDLNIFNLELPLTNIQTPIEKSGPALIGPPEAIRIYRQLAPLLFTLANNHILDQGEQGVISTMKLLSHEGIIFLGAGRNLAEARQARRFKLKDKYLGVYACAEHECTIAGIDTAGANPFDPLTSYDDVLQLKANCHHVIVLYHGGSEEYRYPSPRLQQYCRKFIEKGADLVVCQHSHCVGCREEYQDGTIIYGQGNFLFNIAEDDEYFANGLLLKVTITDELHVEEIPLEKHGTGIRLAGEQERTKILAGYRKRSQEIKDPGFIIQSYEKFAASRIEWYLSFYYLNLLPNFLNGLPKQQYVHMLNNVRCEAHHELFCAGLKYLRQR